MKKNILIKKKAYLTILTINFVDYGDKLLNLIIFYYFFFKYLCNLKYYEPINKRVLGLKCRIIITKKNDIYRINKKKYSIIHFQGYQDFGNLNEKKIFLSVTSDFGSLSSLTKFDNILFDYFFLLYVKKFKRLDSLLSLLLYNSRKLDFLFFNTLLFFNTFVDLLNYSIDYYYYSYLFFYNMNIDFSRLLNNYFYKQMSVNFLIKNLIAFYKSFYIYYYFNGDSFIYQYTLFFLEEYLREDMAVLSSISLENLDKRYIVFFFNTVVFLKVKRRKNFLFFWHSRLTSFGGFFFWLFRIDRWFRLMYFKLKLKYKSVVSFEFFNIKLTEQHLIKKRKNVLIKFYVLPCFRFFLLNKFVTIKNFNFLEVFGNIYFFLLTFLFLVNVNRFWNIKYLLNIQSFILLSNKIIRNDFTKISASNVLNVNLLLNEKKKYKKVCFSFKEFIFFKELIYFFFCNYFYSNSFLNENFFTYKKMGFSSINVLNKYLRKFNTLIYSLKINFNLHFNINSFIKKIELLVCNKSFLYFFKLNLKLLLNGLNSDDKLFILLFDYYFSIFDNFVKLQLLNSIPLYNHKYYFRFFNTVYFFFYDLPSFFYKNIVLAGNIQSYAFFDLKKNFLFINGYNIKYQGLNIIFKLPFYFFFRLFKQLNFIEFKDNKLIFNPCIFLLSKDLKFIYNYFFNIYLSIFSYYSFLKNRFNLRKIYFILRKVCFLTMQFKLKKKFIYSNFNSFFKKFFFPFNLNIFYSKKNYFYMYNSKVFDNLKIINNVTSLFVETNKTFLNIVDTLRRDDLDFARLLDFDYTKNAINVWDMFFFKINNFGNVVRFHRKFYWLFLKEINWRANYNERPDVDFFGLDTIFEVKVYLELFFFDYKKILLIAHKTEKLRYCIYNYGNLLNNQKELIIVNYTDYYFINNNFDVKSTILILLNEFEPYLLKILSNDLYNFKKIWRSDSLGFFNYGFFF